MSHEPGGNLSPKPDKDAMLAALRVLFEDGDIIELRASFSKGKKRIDSGYFDSEHWPALVAHAVRLNALGAAVYVTLNPVDPQLLGRYMNRVQEYASDTTTDANIVRRRWLLIDLDPPRPKGTSASAEQLEAAKQRAKKIVACLRELGWPEPVTALSGNGVHVLYPIELPNDAEAAAIVKGVLAALADRFDDDTVKVDRAVHNAARITKLYGTVANKGDNTPSAPWRLSRLAKDAQRGDPVPLEVLRALWPAVPQAQAPRARVTGDGAFDIVAFLDRLPQPGYRHDVHQGGDRYRLDHCPFNAEHGSGEAAVFVSADGTLGFKCQHDSCADKHWKDVRMLVDGPRPTRGDSLGGVEAAAQSDWGEPQPLTTHAEAEPYPLDALPGTVRAAVEEVQGFTKAPVALVASSALGALSVVIQAHFDIERAVKLTGPSSLFLLVVAPSGERKSTCDAFFMAAIREYERGQEEEGKPKLAAYRAKLAAWEAKRAGLMEAIKTCGRKCSDSSSLEASLREHEDGKPEAPRVPKVLRGDDTPENLAWALAREWPSAGSISAEAGIVFGSHGMAKESIMRNLALLNLLWDGGVLSIGRRTSESFSVRGVRLTVSLQVQDATLRTFLAGAGALARGSGFLARFLIAWPESTQGFRPFTESPASWPALGAFNHRIAEMLGLSVPIDEDGVLSPSLLNLSPAAKARWVAFHDAVEAQLPRGGELYDVRDVASKCADSAVRLAALFHVFECGVGAIGVDTFEAASRIAAWYLNEARRFFGELAQPPELVDAARLDRWLMDSCRRHGVELVRKNHTRQHGPLRDGAKLDAAIRELVELDRVALVKDGKRLIIHVNPALLAGGKP